MPSLPTLEQINPAVALWGAANLKLASVVLRNPQMMLFDLLLKHGWFLNLSKRSCMSQRGRAQ